MKVPLAEAVWWAAVPFRLDREPFPDAAFSRGATFPPLPPCTQRPERSSLMINSPLTHPFSFFPLRDGSTTLLFLKCSPRVMTCSSFFFSLRGTSGTAFFFFFFSFGRLLPRSPRGCWTRFFSPQCTRLRPCSSAAAAVFPSAGLGFFFPGPPPGGPNFFFAGPSP